MNSPFENMEGGVYQFISKKRIAKGLLNQMTNGKPNDELSDGEYKKKISLTNLLIKNADSSMLSAIYNTCNGYSIESMFAHNDIVLFTELPAIKRYTVNTDWLANQRQFIGVVKHVEDGMVGVDVAIFANGDLKDYSYRYCTITVAIPTYAIHDTVGKSSLSIYNDSVMAECQSDEAV